MDFKPSQEQEALREVVHRYLTDNYSFPQRRTLLEQHERLRSRWRALAELGWLGIEVPEDCGGSGGTPHLTATLLDEFGRFLVPEPLLACAVLPARLIGEAADVDQRAELLTGLSTGQILFAVAHRETAARGCVHTRATTLPGGRFLLGGEKSAAVGGDQADWLIVSANTSGHGDDPTSLDLFLVGTELPGVARRNFRTIDGAGAADITLEDVEVDSRALLAANGQGSVALARASEHFVVGSCAEAVGIMDALVALTVDFLKTRRAYGNTLSSYQALQHRLADMLIELELSRSILMRALHSLLEGDHDARRKDTAGARVLVGRAARLIAGAGIQLHGAMGVVDEYIIGHYLKRLNVLFALCGDTTSYLRRYAAAHMPDNA